MILMIDNYDSFTYNIVQYLGELGEEIQVFRNDQITIEEIAEKTPQAIVISPGPCTPNEAGISLDVIQHFKGAIPILGICLGHQSIGQAFGGDVVRAERIMHGKTSEVVHDGKTIFQDIPSPLVVTRYHSLLVKKETMPECLEISAETAEQEVMGLRHREFMIEGLQFHPESIKTDYGKKLIANFVHQAKEFHKK
ncbi:anthranilate/aminodeoxychorismate synthase component II [Desulfuribacillus stibiiarsenatis]|uniref:Anthranilate/aminodeoxychorismate synthase component II n=1 Tax=Desulfuribacillus stibiiarsenatis TaxID=1390249 RepID=A0A1E5L2N5_9FIRM|nr:aminodeoxychorismate/anthranilate synthase component II [Desulfuribacillus stibiiarsenatis]OEH84374.1 anthranilate/aminodeoxychorismate synthase component II [Desulfuribacillus stibiiarsenatis]